MNQRNQKIVIATSYALLFLAFVLLFGSENGVFGEVTNLIEPALKTKIINSLSMFGVLCIAILVWALSTSEKPVSKIATPMLFALWASLALGFTSIDCKIFNFCGNTLPATEDCSTQYDGRGSYIECN